MSLNRMDTDLLISLISGFISLILLANICSTIDKKRKYHFTKYGRVDMFLYQTVKWRFYLFLLFSTVFIIQAIRIFYIINPQSDNLF